MTANEFLEATRWMSEQEYHDFISGMSGLDDTANEIEVEE